MQTLYTLLQDTRIRNPCHGIYEVDRDRPILPPGFDRNHFKEISKAPIPGVGYADIRHVNEDVKIGGFELDEFLRMQRKPLSPESGHIVPLHPNIGVALLYLQDVWISRPNSRSIRFLNERYLLDEHRNRMKIIFAGAAFKNHKDEVCWLSVYADRSSFSFLGEVIPVRSILQSAVRYKHWEILAT